MRSSTKLSFALKGFSVTAYDSEASFVHSSIPPFEEINMFNALNKFISRLDSDSAPQPSTPSGGDSSYGFQVLRNTNKELPIEPWFDFVIGINGHFIVRVKGIQKVW